MELARWPKGLPTSPAHAQRAQRARLAAVGRALSSVLLLLGGLFLLAAVLYGVYSVLNTWLMNQDRYLRSPQLAALAVPAMTSTPTPTPTPTLPPTITPTPTPIPSPTPTPRPTPPPGPAQIRIPALGVTRSIVTLPQVRDGRTGTSTWNAETLFRPGRGDLVGHWEGTAFPGEQGNMVLVGHNYGYGYNGVFVRLGSLKVGHKIHVVNNAGQTFTYSVTQVQHVRWRKKTFQELTQHLNLLSPGGPERLTLVSCAGAEIEPFPERVYVVAEPVR
ncbi:MAG: class F sortase [Anaerolineae bacterium]|nr:class F sortase [Anaerolineae bacterium]